MYERLEISIRSNLFSTFDQMINIFMKNRTYLKSIYDDIKALGIIDTPYDFSRLCGRTPAWYSCIKSRDLPLTADAALTLSISLRIKAEHVCEQEQQRKIIALSDDLLSRTYSDIQTQQKNLLGCDF